MMYASRKKSPNPVASAVITVMINNQQYESVLKHFIKAVEAGDGPALATLFATNGVYCDGFTGSLWAVRPLQECWSNIFGVTPRVFDGS